nr:uncharacterized protein LOC109153479 [Ipomoea trifida]
MAISLPVTFSFNTITHRKPQSLSESTTRALFLFKPSLEILSKSHICFVLPPSNSGDSSGFEKREEARWLREKQRWLREEQRWNVEREALIREIQALQLQIQELKSRSPLQEVSVSVTVANIMKLLQVRRRYARQGLPVLRMHDIRGGRDSGGCRRKQLGQEAAAVGIKDEEEEMACFEVHGEEVFC